MMTSEENEVFSLSRKKKVAFSLVVALIAWTYFECAFRAHDFSREIADSRFKTDENIPTVVDSLLQYRLRPGFSGMGFMTRMKINSLGFRGHELSEKKREGMSRIVALGDSVTFGYGSRDNSTTYPAFLQKDLDEQGGDGKWEVINAGVPGYNSLQALIHLNNDILDLDPDLVLVIIGWNDLLQAASQSWTRNITFVADAKSLRLKEKSSILRMVLDGSALVRRLRAAIANGLVAARDKPPSQPLSMEKPGGESTPAPSGPDIQEPLGHFKRNLRSILYILKGRSIPVAVVRWPTFLKPHLSQKESDLFFDGIGRTVSYEVYYPAYLAFDAAVKEVAGEAGAGFIETEEAFSRDDVALFRDSSHPSNRGNALLAKTILDALIDRGVLTPKAGVLSATVRDGGRS